jgi:2-keto-4-pentenoate hydratase/2-oxohepta-3-ene-1,7-dioic acid hydratase in catechol pathway
MKIIRFVGNDDKVYFGVVESPDDVTARVLEGNIFGEYYVSSTVLDIKNLLAPISSPNIIGIGLNYKKHADETGIKLPDIPVMFLKATGSLTGHMSPIILPGIGAEQVDHEAELAIVIGKRGKNIPKDEAYDYVLGYTCANDVSARDWQIRKQKTQWARGKSFDTFCPIGPWVVTKDEIPDPNNLWIQSEINGKIYQDSNTKDMIFDIPTIISNLSQSITLFPGTIILTGTPNGVGFTRIPPVFLTKGDTVTISIEKIGRLDNPVILESQDEPG